MKTSVELPNNRSAISLESHECEVFQDETRECERYVRFTARLQEMFREHIAIQRSLSGM